MTDPNPGQSSHSSGDTDRLMADFLWSYDYDPPRPGWYVAHNHAKSFDAGNREVIGVCLREKYNCIGKSEDIGEFMDMVEEKAVAVKWFDTSLTGTDRSGGSE